MKLNATIDILICVKNMVMKFKIQPKLPQEDRLIK